MRTLTAAQMQEMPLMRLWLAEYEANPFQTRHLGGESVADVCDRVRQFLLLMIEHHANESILMFCHDLVAKAFRIVLERQDVAAAIATVRMLRIPNCGVHATGVMHRLGWLKRCSFQTEQ
jgi:broad specificity phosphatase PhoE